MDYFDIFNTISSRNLTGKVLKNADGDEEFEEYKDDLARPDNAELFENLIPDTAESWWDKVEMVRPTYEASSMKSGSGEVIQWGVKAQSSFDTRGKCATRLKTHAHINIDDITLVRRGFSSEGIPTLYVPIGTTVTYFSEGQDTDGLTNTSYKTTTEPSNERAGIDLIQWSFDHAGLDQATTNVLKAERPELLSTATIENMTLEEYPKWWDSVVKAYVDTQGRVLNGNYQTYFNQTSTTRKRGGASANPVTYANKGKYRADLIYGYDWQAEVDSKKAGWTIIEGEGFWTRTGYTFLTLSYYVLLVATMFRGSVVLSRLGWVAKGAAWSKKVVMLAIWAVEMLTVEWMSLELPYRVVQVDVTHNYNTCGFPPNGHYHSYWVNVYDPAETDSYGTPHCIDGENRIALTQNPLKYDTATPCCPDNTQFDPTQSLCVGNDIMAIAGGGVLPTEIIPKEEITGLQSGAMIALGVTALVILTTIFSSKGNQ